MNCANCTATAAHEYKLTADASIFFCEKHIPGFLRKAKLAGLLPQTEEHKANLAEGLANISIKPAEEPAPTPTPSTKSAKKTTTTNADNS